MLFATRYRRYILTAAGIWLAVLAGVVLAASTASASTITQSYTIDKNLQRGMIVKISAADKNKVEAVSEKEAEKMEGVLIASGDATVTLTNPNATQQQVFVAKSGRYSLLVSNQAGRINPGDYLAVSSLNGIAMKAGPDQPYVIGKALSGFDGKSNVAGKAILKGKTGISTNVVIGQLAADITVARNPLQRQGPIIGLSFLQTAGNAIAQKQVDTVRIYVGALLLLMTSVITGGILYSGVRTSMVSIGRNPLAKNSIAKGLVQITLISIIIFIIGLLGIYLILKL